MKHIQSFENFANTKSGHINEEELAKSVTDSVIVNISLDIDWNEKIGKVEDKVTLAMSNDSRGIYSLGKDIEKYTGVPEKDVIRDVAAGKEKPDDAIIYGMCNAMNGGADIYFWTNGTRLNGAATKLGVWPAVFEQVSHECIHLTRLILIRAIAKKMGADNSKGEWLDFDFGAGASVWPAIGDPNDKNKIIMIDEEAFATSVGYVVQQITNEWMKLATKYVPQLAAASKI